MSRLEQLQKLVAQSPDDPMTHYVLGLEFANQERWDEAIAAYDRALEVDCNYIAAYYHKARAEIRGGWRESAVGTLRAGQVAARAVGDEKTWAEMQDLAETIA